MGWWEIVKLVLKFGPSVWAIITEIIDLIKQLQADQPDVAAFYTRRLDVQIAAAKVLKSKDPLHELANQLRGVLRGADK